MSGAGLGENWPPPKTGAQNTEKGRKMPSKTPVVNPLSPCPCGSQKSLANCCQPYILGQSWPETAEQLMRSRYSAHVLLAIDYLWDTWSPEQRLRSSKADIQQWAQSCDWLGLQILATDKGQSSDQEGTVEFVALFRQNGQAQQHHELSLFRKSLGKWLYVDHRD